MGLHPAGKAAAAFNPSPLVQRRDGRGSCPGRALQLPAEPRRRVHRQGEILKVMQSLVSANTG